MKTRELIHELERFDPESEVVVSVTDDLCGARVVEEVGRRERGGLVQPQIYVVGE